MKKVIRYFQGPTYTAGDWTARNPYLKIGEIGYLLESGIVTRAKVGPGYWNDLTYLADDIYPYSDAITNVIGDVNSPVNGQKLAAIIKKMISPYVQPAISNLTNNLGGLSLNIVTREIGESFNTSFQLNFVLANGSNLSGATPVNVDGAGIFTSGAFPLALPISMSILSPPFAPTLVTEINIGVTLTHLLGTTPAQITKIRVYPKVMWVSSILSSMPLGSDFMAAAGKQMTVTNSYKRDYGFAGGGYSWLAIPSMLGPASLVFTDVTNPDLPLGYSMESKGTLSINNGVGTYNYEMYRSTFNLIQPSTLRVK